MLQVAGAKLAYQYEGLRGAAAGMVTSRHYNRPIAVFGINDLDIDQAWTQVEVVQVVSDHRG